MKVLIQSSRTRSAHDSLNYHCNNAYILQIGYYTDSSEFCLAAYNLGLGVTPSETLFAADHRLLKGQLDHTVFLVELPHRRKKLITRADRTSKTRGDRV